MRALAPANMKTRLLAVRTARAAGGGVVWWRAVRQVRTVLDELILVGCASRNRRPHQQAVGSGATVAALCV